MNRGKVLEDNLIYYSTWMPELATNESDGLPDLVMVPLVEALRVAGFTTFQSCGGHVGESDGTLWIRERPQYGYRTAPFDRIQTVLHGPEGRCWEWWWTPARSADAIEALVRAYLGGPAVLDALNGETE